MTTEKIETINLLVGTSGSSSTMRENLPVLSLGDEKYKLLTSPGLVLGLAKDDEVKYVANTGEFELLRRGRNVCVQVFHDPGIETIIEELITRVTTQLKGTLDGQSEKFVVFTVPIETGFGDIETVMNDFVAESGICEWYFGNVYGEDGETPLDWWMDEPVK